MRTWPSAWPPMLEPAIRKRIEPEIFKIRRGKRWWIFELVLIGAISGVAPGLARSTGLSANNWWGGLLFSVALGGAVGFGLMWLQTSYRRQQIREVLTRDYPHLCPNCGYPYGNAPRCTECGEARQ